MRLASAFAAALLLTPVLGVANASTSQDILPESFKPPQVFRNKEVSRTINLEKNYVRQNIDLVIENVDKSPQSAYYLPFDGDAIRKVGSVEVRDKKDAAKTVFDVEPMEYDAHSSTQFYRISLPKPLAPKSTLSLTVSYVLLSSLHPLPKRLPQTGKQYLEYRFSAYMPSAYATVSQKTKVRLPPSSSDISDYTKLPGGKQSENEEDPVKSGKELTYGSFKDIPAGASEQVYVRYDHPKPVIHVHSLQRDIEVSHWGGNLATEERYELENLGAAIDGHFSRVEWAATQYYKPETHALRELKVPLAAGSASAYFIDDVGNVSTSNFRSSRKESLLELKPRFPLFGGWRYKFRVGWDRGLGGVLRKVAGDDGYVLRVPFLEGPRQAEGVEYERVQVRIILPEGARNVKYETVVPIIAEGTSLHKTFMDTQGRTALTLAAINLVDEPRDRDIIVTYDYPSSAGLQKPLTVLAGTFAIFVAAWAVRQVDVSISSKKGQ